MGIDTNAVLVVGLPDDEINITRNEDSGDWDEEGILSQIPAYFDADEGIVGVEVVSSPDYSEKEIDMQQLIVDVEDARELFKKLTGQDGKLYLSPRVW